MAFPERFKDFSQRTHGTMSEFLRISDLSKHFRGLVANDHVSFSIGKGEVRCIIGPNGAGKTTFIGMISGHILPSSGTIVFKGANITHSPVHLRARRGIGRKFQTPSVFNNLPIFQNIELAALRVTSDRREIDRITRHTMELTRLEEVSDRPALTLSHGQRQWLEIGMLIANRSELLLLDEPTAGMSAEETHATANLVRRLAAEYGLSVIIIEHDINFVRDLNAPVTVLHLGKVLVEGDFQQISANQEVRNVYLGGGFEC